ncbi:MAG TPA: hypothetical protein VFU21_07275 [Kofleriaceae bacterium]|nr:hypothetical protein [Kofleriaceae bacterium]
MHDRHLRAGVGAALIALVALASDAAGQAKRVSRVGVVVAVHVNRTEEEAQALGDQIGAGLRDALVIDVVAGAQAARRLPPKGVGELCVARPECVKDTAQRLDADQLLFLVVVRLGKRVQVEPTWTDATGSQSASRDTIVLEAGAAPREVFAGAATRLLPEIAVRSQGAPPTEPAQPTGAADPPPTGGADVVAPAPPPPRRRVHPGTWIAGGVAVAALAGGVAFGLAAKSGESDLEDDGCGTEVVCSESRIDSVERKALLADVFYGTAVVAAGAAVFIQLRWGTARREPAPVSVGPTSDGAGAALHIGGAF